MVEIVPFQEVLNYLIITVRAVAIAMGRRGMKRSLERFPDFAVAVRAVDQMLLKVPECLRVLALVDHFLLDPSRWRDIGVHLRAEFQLEFVHLGAG